MPDPIDWGTALPFYLAALIGGYLLGSIPFGLLIARAMGLGDVRNMGSGNIGATNVLRTGSKLAALATLAGDMGKGAAAVLIARMWGPDIMTIAAFGAFLGHLYPVWLGFRGGKGVATFLGIALAVSFWPAGVLTALAWLVAAAVFRFSSLASLASAAAAPVAFNLYGSAQMMELFLALAVLIFWRHRSNIGRLLKGTEPRIGEKKDKTA
ncbi:MAG: glycerol-3-phosphate 1-O-acyltransferase PlsY [Alphaproteobacteria bacterium]|nr:glycerol-3-phosphate 1-O-acyltransferase PlsY [Alphaproteobacteria bacterium]MDX5368435.1 glycerol-3-phosphate 1-O-acyltransferase PlsY [Alphaproteobacteria bacterium]MDX5463230.1 glycerol-3-phosphate 1-O-acyltransferase PlsY [Alphaproteobacteria bacterium]